MKTSPEQAGRTPELATVPLRIRQVRLPAKYDLRVLDSRRLKQSAQWGSLHDREARTLQGCVEALLDVQALAADRDGNGKLPQAEVGLRLMRR